MRTSENAQGCKVVLLLYVYKTTNNLCEVQIIDFEALFSYYDYANKSF